MKTHGFSCIGTDCGGSSCKALFAVFDGEKIRQEEYIGFPNKFIASGKDVFFDIASLFQDSENVISELSAKHGAVNSIGFDTHGGQHFLLDQNGNVVKNPYYYAGPSKPDILNNLYSEITKEDVYRYTGSICSRGFCLPWLLSDRDGPGKLFDIADKFVMFSDLMTFHYCGRLLAEKTISSTSGLVSVDQKSWAWSLLERLKIPSRLFMPISEPCVKAGKVNIKRDGLECLKETYVVTVAGHDSAGAVSALPGFGNDKIYIGLGTAANFNFLVDAPIYSSVAFNAGIKTASFPGTNQYMAYFDIPAFLVYDKMKLSFEKEGHFYPYSQLSSMALSAADMRSWVDLDDPRYTSGGGDIIQIMSEELKSRSENIPENDAEWIKLFFNSLTHKLCCILIDLKREFGKSFNEIVVINGGSLHYGLMQQIADATNLPVKAGVQYASLLGNVLNQLLAMGEVATVDEMRQVANNSIHFTTFEPRRNN